MFTATTEAATLFELPTLAEARAAAVRLHAAGYPDDIVVWHSAPACRVVLVMTSDGRAVEMDGYSLTWTWPAAKEGSSCVA